MLFGKSFNFFRKRKIPKIMCTLGTTTDDKNILAEMVAAGMAAARINTAYATILEYKKRIDALRSIADIPIVLDLKGSQIRLVTEISNGKRNRYSVVVGDEFIVGFQGGEISFNYDLSDSLLPGDWVLFENGTITTVVIEKKEKYAKLQVIEAGDGYIRHGMGVNIPGRLLRGVPRLSDKDFDAIDFAFAEGIEYLAVSFVRESEDVLFVKRELEKRRGGRALPWAIAKIEDPTGIKNLPIIIGDARKAGMELTVMIGRGDLFVEAPKHALAVLQKKIIGVCKKLGASVIVATGLLESMQFNRHPTKAEVCDTTNAVLDEPDWLMLSAETSNSHFPVEAVTMLRLIIQECEN